MQKTFNLKILNMKKKHNNINKHLIITIIQPIQKFNK